MLLTMLIRTLAGMALLAIVLFVPAGTLVWPQAWAFMAVFCGCSWAIGIWLNKTDPGLLAERMKSPFSAAQRPRDRMVMGAIALAFWSWLALMALDSRRFEWSHVPLWAEVVGGVLVLAAFCGWTAVLRVNSYAAVTVRLQADRGQHVVTTGPYSVVRHPMYAFALFFFIGTPLLLGSLWGLAGAILFVPLLVARILGEEALLAEGLAVYREYADRVRFRLIPGIW